MTFHSTDFSGSKIVSSLLVEQTIARSATASTIIVVPCYNEANRLDADAFLGFLDAVTDIQLVFVNDGSRDTTLDLLAQMQQSRPERIKVLSLKANAGKAEAVRQGLIYATSMGADFVGYWDADLATPLETIPDFNRIVTRYHDVDVVFGSRCRLLGHRIERTLVRRTISRVCSLLARMAVKLPISDTQCGAKLLRNTNTLRKALNEPFTAGWLFDVELFTRISRYTTDRTRAFYQYPLSEWSEIEGSKVSAKAVFKSGLQMLRLIVEARTGFLQQKLTASANSEIVILPSAPARTAA